MPLLPASMPPCPACMLQYASPFLPWPDLDQRRSWRCSFELCLPLPAYLTLPPLTPCPYTTICNPSPSAQLQFKYLAAVRARPHPGPVVGNNAIMPYGPCDSLVRSPAVRPATTGTAARASVVKPHYRLLARRRRVVRTHARSGGLWRGSEHVTTTTETMMRERM